MLLRQIGVPLLWKSLEPSDETTFAAWGHLWAVTTPTVDPSTLTPLLKDVAEEGLTDVIIAPEDFTWLYHPYDGGADILAQPIMLEFVRANYSDWISSRPDGL